MLRARIVCSLSLCSLAALAVLGTTSVAKASPRYGGVWHEGTATGAFVPLEAGFSFIALQQYRTYWDTLRITDFEIHPTDCPADELDLTASQWEEGSWRDELLVYSSMSAFETGLEQMCDEGMVLHDFELWDSECEEQVQYIALFREGDCDPEFAPVIKLSDVWDFGTMVADANDAGYEAVDFEIVEPESSEPPLLAVFYGGERLQTFATLDRPDFESTMLDNEGTHVLQDMESYRAEETRYVCALWNLQEGRDEHEVGEVYGMFSRLLYMDETTRKLEDFEVYPDVYDRRYEETFNGHLDQPQAFGYAVVQGGDVVAEGGGGLAVRSNDTPSNQPGIAMTADTIGVSASVTKLVTTLGVIAYAETLSDPDGWLDSSITTVLPADFVDLGEGVADVTIRELLTQHSGLEKFTTTPGSDFISDPAGWRGQLVEWLMLPIDSGTQPKPRKYQNVHFELLAIIMNEVVLPPLMPGPEPWQDWVNAQVFAPVGVGWRDCFRNANDALSYPYEWSPNAYGVSFSPAGWSCAGGQTGVGMFWVSPMDMAKLADGIRNGVIIDPDRADDLFDVGMGLDAADDITAYSAASDWSSNTLGEAIHSKNGGLIGWNSDLEWVGMETVVVMYDDHDVGDNGGPEYDYDVGSSELSLAIAVHSTPISKYDVCDFDDETVLPPCTRLYPAPWSMIVEALLLPEDW